MVKQSQVPPVLLTRPLPAAQRFADQIRAALGPLNITLSPLQSVVPVKGPLPKGEFAAVIFTSENAVMALKDCDWQGPKLAYCVGKQTALAAQGAGFETLSAQGDALALANLIRARTPDQSLLHLHGEHIRQDFAELGLRVQGHVVYRTETCPLNASALGLLQQDKPVIAPVFSPRSAALLMRCRPNGSAPLWFATLSPAVADALTLQSDDRVAISDRPEAQALIGAMERLLSDVD